MFCVDCGARLAAACPACGADLFAGARFCGNCGAPAGPPAESRFAVPDAYTPRHLAERILTSRSAVEGERKRVTVLFADLRGSMELLAGRDPEEARKLLDPVLGHMMEAVHHYEGTVNQVMGDGIMALFGAPLALEDHAVRACYAALRMQESVKHYAETLRRTEGIAVQIRVGLNSGEVVVRSIGSDLRMDYSAVGQTTHLAARMEQMATPGSILATRETLSLAEGYVVATRLGPLSIRGLDAPVEVFALVDATAVYLRFQAAARRGLSRFVGRAAEFGELRQALERAAAGRGQIVAVVGEAGLGKSRLFHEFTHARETQGWLMLAGGSTSFSTATPYLPAIHLFQAYFKIETSDAPQDVRDKVTGKMMGLDRSLEPWLPPLLALLGAPVEDTRWEALAPRQRRQEIIDAVAQLLLRESRVQPVLLAVEDLHWIDAETQAILDRLVDSLPAARMLLLVNYRPEYRHGWGNRSQYSQIRIDPLPPDRAGDLLESLVGSDPALDPLKRLLVERTEGNPFFLEESVRTLVESGALVGGPGAYRLTRGIQAIQVPPTVQAVIAARIDRLAPGEKRLLQSAAVIGKELPFPLLQATVDLEDDALRDGLGRLRASEFLYETSLFPELEYTFKHSLIHEVAYGTLLGEQRRALHARVVGALERLYPGRRAEHVEQLAHHAVHGQLWEQAVIYLREAGDKAFARSAHHDAVRHVKGALAALEHLPAGRDRLEQAIDLRFDLRRSLQALGEPERAHEHLREAGRLAEELGDRRRIGWIACYEAIYFWNGGVPDRAAESARRARELGVEEDDVALQAVADFSLGWAHLALGAYRAAIGCFTKSTALLPADMGSKRLGLGVLPPVGARTYRVFCLGELGEFTEAIAQGEEAVGIADAADDQWSRACAYYGLGFALLQKGDLARATIELERGLELCRRFEIPSWITGLASALGYAYALSGRLPRALDLLNEGVAQGSAMGTIFRQSVRIAWLAEAHLLSGHLEEAVRLATEAVALARRHQERGHEAYTLRLLGEVTASRDHPEASTIEGYYREALAIAEELDMRPLQARCHLGLGSVHRDAAGVKIARGHLETACALFRDMEMPLWLERSEAALRALE